MARLKIHTPLELYAAMEKIPSLRSRLAELDTTQRQAVRTNSYQAWFVVRDACHDAIAAKDWSSLKAMFALHEGVERAGRRSQVDGGYVAFVEDLRLPTDQRDRNSVFAAAGPALRAELERTFRRVRG